MTYQDINSDRSFDDLNVMLCSQIYRQIFYDKESKNMCPNFLELSDSWFVVYIILIQTRSVLKIHKNKYNEKNIANIIKCSLDR